MKPAATAWDPDLAHEVPVAVIVPGTETVIHLQCLAISTALSRHYVKHFIAPEAARVEPRAATFFRHPLSGTGMCKNLLQRAPAAA